MDRPSFLMGTEMADEDQMTTADWAILCLQNVQYVYRRGNHYIHNGRHYERVEDQIMLRHVSQFITHHIPSAASAYLVDQVAKTMAQMRAVHSEPPEPLRLNGQPVGNIVVFENGTLDIEVLIDEELREPKRISYQP